jgi:outer membrane lipoprotein SlyB
MRTLVSIASLTVLAATLSACGTVDPYGPNNYPVSQTTTTTTTYPSTYPNAVVTSNIVEFGRVSNIELIAANTAPRGNSTAGTLIGGAVGALLGNQIGSGGGRAAATVLGAVGGAVVGNKIAQNRDGTYDSNVYRISVQTDNGAWRSYDVAATGDLRVGDRVRIENNVLYRA